MTAVEPIYHTVGARILALRQARGMTQGELADAVGISRPALANIEAFRQRIMLHQLEAFGEALGVPWLLLVNDKPWQDHSTADIAEAFNSY